MNTAEKLPRITAEVYFQMSEHAEERTELIDGEIMALARPNIRHQVLSGRMFAKVDQYIQSKNGKCLVVPEIDVQLFGDTVVVPDLSVVCDSSKLDENRCYGAPDWVAEITSTNFGNDYRDKLMLYREAGVREYWIIDTQKQKVTVLLFGKSASNMIFYDWTDEIPVHIYQGELKIRINDLL